tara:strand:- start:6487 stop:7548 length:1062 start_codon:yes stop_codon:yes gene_type:complete
VKDSFNTSPSEEEIRQALSFIDSSCARDAWVRIGMAIKSELGDSGFMLFDDWSASADNYTKSAALSTWKSIKGVGAGNSVTISTLFSEAMKFGYKPDAKELSVDELRKREALALARAEKRKQDELAEQQNAEHWRNVYAEFFARIWPQLLGSIGPSKYVARKQVGCYGLGFPRHSFVIVTDTVERCVAEIAGADNIRAFFKDERFKDSDRYSIRYVKRGTFLIPLRDLDGVIYNAQLIYESGKKSFFREAPKQGLFHLLAKPEENKPLALAEGYATGAAITKATGWSCAIAFDVYNLKPVAVKLVSTYVRSPLVICGDDDVNTKDNPGRTLAEKLAKQLKCRVVFPRFGAVQA